MPVKTPRIVIVGSLNMDLVISMEQMPKVGETVQAQSIHYIPGGKGANQAVGCSRLGAQIDMIGAVGGDPFGDQIIGQMKRHGVNTEHISVLEGVSTGTATIFHTRQDNCIAIVAGANEHCSADQVSSCESLIRQADLLLVQLEIPLESVRQALTIARSAGVKTVLNPAPAKPLPDELLQLVDLLTPNETEFAALSGAEPDSEAAWQQSMTDWERRHGHKVVVTRGAAGSSYLDDSGALVTVPALTVSVVDTTGAGDSFNAALSYGLALGWTLHQAVSFAGKAASLSVTKFGAQDGMPKLDEVMEAGR
ncbi:ribokinase [Paenibacillus oceani]|uniref:Ribokinase n=1 Tax=Paenibacillus oceani TaxID=2772510 RepID=A0A927H2Y3_9BACL|nr:ribokinase [Paenibacillus oceani]MBD2865772.1 ribokinase [Paenibacillus oceani]